MALISVDSVASYHPVSVFVCVGVYHPLSFHSSQQRNKEIMCFKQPTPTTKHWKYTYNHYRMSTAPQTHTRTGMKTHTNVYTLKCTGRNTHKLIKSICGQQKLAKTCKMQLGLRVIWNKSLITAAAYYFIEMVCVYLCVCVWVEGCLVSDICLIY